ncbi:TPA: hypothetical protein ACXJQL_000363 [Stenotrophomonas maltophilia]
MSTTKNKGGRPPRAPGEKLQRINLTLRPRLLFGLEVVARDRRSSISQAAEYLIQQQLQSYMIGEVPALGVLDRMSIKAGTGYDPAAGGDLSEDQRREAWINEIVRTEPGRALFMPRQLLQPQERYFRELYEGILEKAVERGEYRGGYMLISPEILELMYTVAKGYEQEGKPIAEAVDRFYEMLAAADALQQQRA